MTTERARPFAVQTSSKHNLEGVFCCSPIPRDDEMTIRQVVVAARTESVDRTVLQYVLRYTASQ